MKKDYSEGMSVKNKYGEWVPAIPEPYWTGFLLRKAQCVYCQRKPFNSEEAYRGHYALKHILGL